MIPLLRRSTTNLNKKNRPIIVFNCSLKTLSDRDGILIINLTRSNDELDDLGRAYLSILISDFVLFEQCGEDNEESFLQGLLVGFCDNQDKLYGGVCSNEKNTFFGCKFDSKEKALEWIGFYVEPKKLKLKGGGGNLYLNSLRKYINESLNQDTAIRKIYFEYPRVRKVIDKLPRSYEYKK